MLSSVWIFDYTVRSCLSLLVSTKEYATIALAQRTCYWVGSGIALLPGISRLASVFVATRWLGYTNRQAFEISWMVQVPLIVAAATKGLYVLCQQNELYIFTDWYVWVVIAVATLLSWCTLWVCNWLVRRNRVWWCAVYMVVPLVMAILIMQCS